MKEIVIFERYNKMYMTDKSNYYSGIFNLCECVHLSGFKNLEDAKQFIEKQYNCKVYIG